MEIRFALDRVTKNTIRFAEEVEGGELAVSKIGTLYVPKSTLAELGYTEGDGLTVALQVTAKNLVAPLVAAK